VFNRGNFLFYSINIFFLYVINYLNSILQGSIKSHETVRIRTAKINSIEEDLIVEKNHEVSTEDSNLSKSIIDKFKEDEI